MTKIEELAKEAIRKEYLCEKCLWKENCDFCGGENSAFDCCECPADSYEDGFKVGANYVYGLPLSSRLTPEEKERVRGAYAEAQSWLDEKPSIDNCNSHLRVCAVAIQDRLERIFGSDFFREGE